MSHLVIRHPEFGDIVVRETDGAITALEWLQGDEETEPEEPSTLLNQARAALHVYFATGDLPPGLALNPAGTLYQKRVWAYMQTIPRGETRRYGEVAAAIGGSPLSVGGAACANPIPLLIPCHRVVSKSGLGGYCGSDDEGWGLAMKRRLLVLEGASIRPSRTVR
ncbi:MAG: methylated-DNA--[protein]-cysteine S-methyltransferase [Acidiphilium sp.]|nr:methylated-DNA--[protein]-cysteine S-methyltransferase [Acidiphilium sp.]MDD4936769.1 methylated-DNA--[protein]-cysteine S-methyltransferase [Acidiphilium sp.]